MIWAGFRKLDNFAVHYANTILPLAEEHPELRASLLYCASRHRDALRLDQDTCTKPLDFNRQLLLKSWALRAVREALIELQGNQHGDALIHSILWLAVNERSAGNITAADPSPFLPPMRGRHWLAHYGTMQFDINHWKACVGLISSRGGIRQLKTYGTAWFVS